MLFDAGEVRAGVKEAEEVDNEEAINARLTRRWVGWGLCTRSRRVAEQRGASVPEALITICEVPTLLIFHSNFTV